MKAYALLAVLLLAGAAQAATVTITGTNPTTNTDNSTIPATGEGSLASLILEYGTCNGAVFGTKTGEVTRPAVAPGATFSEVLNLPPGQSCIRAYVANTYGKVSPPSNVRTHSVEPSTPRPPVLARRFNAAQFLKA